MTQNFLWLVSPEAGYNFVFMGSQFYNVTGFDANENPIFSPNAPNADKSTLKRGIFQLRGSKPLLSRAMAKTAAASLDVDGTGQAGGNGALISQSGSLVYYAEHANDVYVGLFKNQASVPYFQTQQNFPTSTAQVAQIGAAAKATYNDAISLSLELKSSWIDAATIPASDLPYFLTMSAEVPNFVPNCPTSVPAGCKLYWDGNPANVLTKTLALVGLHVVVPVQNHPEMVWATFEQAFNAPDNTFAFIGPGNQVSTQTYQANGPAMTFFATNTPIGSANTQLVKSKTAPDNSVSIVAVPPTGPGGATSAVRFQPWGGIQPANPSATDPTVINNTALMSLAVSVAPQLITIPGGGTARAGYFQSGAVWTTTGGIPTAAPTTPTTSGQPPLAGSPVLANTTMETFHQKTTGKNQAGCFSCHFSSSATQGVGVSHLFNLTASSSSQSKTK
jgi:hypothetical protein